MADDRIESILRQLETGGLSRNTIGALIELVTYTMTVSGPLSLHGEKEGFAKDTMSSLELMHEVFMLRDEISSLSWNLHEYMWPKTLGVEDEDVDRPQFAPARIYVDDGDQESIEKAFHDVLDAHGLIVSIELPSEYGSWFKRMFVRTKEATTVGHVRDTLSDLEKTLEMRIIATPEPEIDSRQSESVALLLDALQRTEEAVIQIGSILLIKHAGAILARSLTPRELIYFERHSFLFKSPAGALDALRMLSLRNDQGSASDITQQ